MKFVSTHGETAVTGFTQALFKGQAPDGGLYIPVKFPRITEEELEIISAYSFNRLAEFMVQKCIPTDLNPGLTESIIEQAYDFGPELKQIDDELYILELFHGPTLSFKDFGAQFMAKTMAALNPAPNDLTTILVATSGDTGSAVAHAFYKVPGFRVVLLYPSGKVSMLQEQQLTTIGGNVHALEIQGTFDDCQSLVKKAFSDPDLNSKLILSSANSINVGRLIPQSFYYIWAITSLMDDPNESIVVSVPSGNFGNLTAGLYAEAMGLSVEQFIAAVNTNRVVPDYLESGNYEPRPSQKTLSTAMDVGDPSNWARIRSLYNDDWKSIRDHLWSDSVDDSAIRETIQEVYEELNTLVDPHTAVGLKALERFRHQHKALKRAKAIVLATAHPGKFEDIVSTVIGKEIELPQTLEDAMNKSKQSVIMKPDYQKFVEFLRS
jgi:threonine synthase